MDKDFFKAPLKGRLGYDHVTPHMHCLLYHVPNITEKLRPFEAFERTGSRELDDCIKTVYQKSSNK